MEKHPVITRVRRGDLIRVIRYVEDRYGLHIRAFQVTLLQEFKKDKRMSKIVISVNFLALLIMPSHVMILILVGAGPFSHDQEGMGKMFMDPSNSCLIDNKDM